MILKAMAKDPKDRYTSSIALAYDLSCYRMHRRTSCDSRMLGSLLWIRRAPLLAAALVALIATLLLLGLSIAGARLLVVLFGVMTLVVMYNLAYRMYGLPSAYLTVLILLILPGAT
ncbi:MAG: hypothetical protein HC933_09885, partial [Pleurocapsa sp. SU_196_0]|nr:hypothetical protein [Pleurocapsa sp. SU_196_0]